MKTLIKLMHISEAAFIELQWRYGVAYANHQWGHSPVFMDQLLQTTAYWRWWRNQFNIRNRALVSLYGLESMQPDSRLVAQSLWYLFADCHNAENIAAFPCNVVMDSILTEIAKNTMHEN
ncbi:MAG: hypothetical protein MH137_11285 [Flavobacteriales bacterium]|nr:hypothetical protein [Flavobacteriales bacterium]